MKIKSTLFLLLFYIVANAQPGEIDTAFGNNGKVTTGFGSNRNTANAVAFQADGKFLVGGTCVTSQGNNDFALVRYNSDGSLDTTFGAGGKVITSFTNNYNFITSIYVLADGKIMVTGNTSMVSFLPNLAIVRYHTDGSLDSSFGTNGKLISGLIPLNPAGNKLVFQPDGKFIITASKKYNMDPTYYVGVERYTADGVIDTTFGTNGLTVTSFGTGQNIPCSVALQPDGKIVIASKYQATTLGQISVARLDSNGALDNTFDSDGKTVTGFGPNVYCETMHLSINSSGKIIVGGIIHMPSRNFGLVQYNTNGSLDTSFDGDGKATAAFPDTDDTLNSIIRQADGKFLVATKSDNFALTTSDLVVRRYNSDISLDTTFGTNGQVSTTFGTGRNEAQLAEVSPDGKIVVVGQSIPLDNGNYDFAVARYSMNGILDTTLDTDGKVTASFESTNDLLNQLLVKSDDSLIAVGISTYRQSNNTYIRNIALSKYNSDGSLDTTFGTSGKVVSVFGQNSNYVATAALQPDGKILVANTYFNVSVDNFAHYEVIRYHANGTLDTSFGSNGKAVLNFEPSSIAVQPDGKIVVAGINPSANTGYSLTRFTTNGTLDTGFDTDGSVFVPFESPYYGKIAVLAQSDGKIVVTGSTSSPDLFNGVPVFAAARLTTNGTLDATFGTNGKTATLINDNCFSYAGFMQPDGKIVIAGLSFSGGIINFSSIRYNNNGMLDATYGTNGTTSTHLAFDYRIINSIALQADGKFLVALSKYNQPQHSYDFKIRRFNPDGTFDNDFGGLAGVTTSFFNGYDEAFSIGLQSDHKIIVGGITNGINNDFAITRYTNTVLGVFDFYSTADDSIVLYPNPVTGILNIKTADAQFDIVECSVYNMLGQLVYKSHNETTIDTYLLQSGIYSVQIKTNKGTIAKKFIRK